MTNIVECYSIISTKIDEKITKWSKEKISIENLVFFLKNILNIDATLDKDIVNSYERDYSNLPGNADVLCRSVSDEECAIILKCCRLAKIRITISAGRTNLNGSATPNGGVVLSMEKMIVLIGTWLKKNSEF